MLFQSQTCSFRVEKVTFLLKGVVFSIPRYYFSMLNDFHFQCYEFQAFSDASKHTYVTVDGNCSHHILPPCLALLPGRRICIFCLHKFLSCTWSSLMPFCIIYFVKFSIHLLRGLPLGLPNLFSLVFFFHSKQLSIPPDWNLLDLQSTFSSMRISLFLSLSSSVIPLMCSSIFISVAAHTLSSLFLNLHSSAPYCRTCSITVSYIFFAPTASSVMHFL